MCRDNLTALYTILSLLTCLLTPRCRVLLGNLIGLQPVKKFPAFHGTRKFITAHTSVRHLSLSWASPIQSIYPHPTSWISIVILSAHLRLGLPIGLFPSGFPTKTLYTPSPHPYAPHAQPISFFSILSPAQYCTPQNVNSCEITAIPQPSVLSVSQSVCLSFSLSVSQSVSQSVNVPHLHFLIKC